MQDIHQEVGMIPDADHNDSGLSADFRAVLALMRGFPMRPAPDEPLLALCRKVPDDLKVFFDTIARYDILTIWLGDYLLDVPKLMASWRRSSRAKTPRILALGHSESGGRYKVQIRGESVRILLEPAMADQDEVNEFYSLDAFFSEICSAGAALPEAFLEERLREKAMDQAAALLADPESQRRRAEADLAEGRVGLAPWPQGPAVQAEDTDELFWEAAGCQVAFVRRQDREDVEIVRADGTRRRLDLPSPGPYRDRAALSPDGTRLLVAGPVRTRVFDLESGQGTVVLEGPLQQDLAWLAEEKVAVLVRGGRWNLDLSDPDVRALSSLRKADRSGAFVPVDTVGMVHVVDIEEVRLVSSLACEARHMESILDGQALVVRRPSDSDKWGTAILVLQHGGLSPLQKFEVDIGKVRQEGRDIVSAFGFQLMGLPEAVEAHDGFVPSALLDSLEMETKETEAPRSAITTEEGPLRLVPVEIEPPGDKPHRAVRKLFRKGDWISPHIEQDHALALEKLPQTSEQSVYRAVLVAGARSAHPRRVEIRPAQKGEQFVYCFAQGGESLALWTESRLVEVRTKDGMADRIAMVGPRVEALQWLGPDRIAVLVQVLDDKRNLEIYGRRPKERWRLEGLLPLDAFDEFFAVPARGLFAFTFKHMPQDEAFTAFVLEHEHGFSFLGQFPLAVSDLWEKKEGDEAVGVYIATADQRSYRVEALEEALIAARQKAAVEDPPAEPMWALVYDVRQGMFGQREVFGISSRRFGTAHGYIDSCGAWVFEPRFSGGREFEGDQVVVTMTRHDRFGRIAADGQWVLPARFTFIGPNKEGRSRVAQGGRLTEAGVEGAGWGLCDRDGRWIVRPNSYRDMGDAHDGLCRVALDGERQNYIDLSGRLLLEKHKDRCLDFSCGRGAVLENGRWSFVDRNGDPVGDGGYSSVVPYREDVAAVQLDGRHWRFVDLDGTPLGEETFDECYPPNEGLGLVRKGDRWGYVDASGRLKGEVKFERTYIFHSGMGNVVLQGRFHYVNEDLEALGPGWDQTYRASEGIGLVRTRDRYGFVDQSGRMIADMDLTMAYSFQEGLAPARRGPEWGYLGPDGQWAIEPRFQDAGLFFDGLAAVRLGDSWGYIDKTGTMVIEPAFEVAYAFTDGRALVKVPHS